MHLSKTETPDFQAVADEAFSLAKLKYPEDELTEKDILVVNSLGFKDPHHVKYRRDHLGFNLEIWKGYFEDRKGEDAAL